MNKLTDELLEQLNFISVQVIKTGWGVWSFQWGSIPFGTFSKQDGFDLKTYDEIMEFQNLIKYDAFIEIIHEY